MATYLTDTFTGTNGAAWSSVWAATGQNGGTATIQGNRGRLTRTTARVARRSAAATPADIELLYSFGFVAMCWPRTYLRGNSSLDSGAGYLLEPNFGTATVGVRRDGSATATYSGGTSFADATAPAVFAAGTRFLFRVKVVTEPSAVRISVKVWLDGSTEPAGWQEFLDSSAGRITAAGVTGYSMDAPASGGAAEYDDVVFRDPVNDQPSPALGAAAGAWTTTGAATGRRQPSGTAAGSWATGGVTAGRAQRTGTASGAWATAGSAIGRTTRRGVAAGTATSSGQAVGVRPAVATRSGAAAGTWTGAGFAAGRRRPLATTASSWATTGTAAGRRRPTGGTAGTWSTAGTAAGYRPGGGGYGTTDYGAALLAPALGVATLGSNGQSAATLSGDGIFAAAIQSRIGAATLKIGATT